ERFDENMFVSQIPRESINEILCDLLHLHAGFLKVAIDIRELNPARVCPTVMAESVAKIAQAHRAVLDLFVKERRSEFDYIGREVRRVIFGATLAGAEPNET